MEVYIAELNPEGIKEIVETPSLMLQRGSRTREVGSADGSA